jgi:hypothetical protein
MHDITHIGDLLPSLPAEPEKAASHRGRGRKPLPWERCPGKRLERPTALDTTLLRAIDYFGVANAHHLAALIGSNIDWIERRLHLLYDTEYLERPDPQFTGLAPGDDKRRFRFTGWSTPIAYTLWPRGAEYLAAQDGSPAAALMKRVPTWETFHHDLETTALVAGIELCCRQSSSVGYVPTEAFYPGERPHRGISLYAGGMRTTTDWGPFAVDRGAAGVLQLIIERDRNTEPKHRYSDQRPAYIAKKVEAYEAIRAAWQSDPGSSPIGSGDFVVLFPTTTTARRDALAGVARELAGENADRYWFTDNAALEEWNVIDPRDLGRNLVLLMPWITGRGEKRTLGDAR